MDRVSGSSWGLSQLYMVDDGQVIVDLNSGKDWVYPMTYDGTGFGYDHQSGDKTASVYIIDRQGLWWRFTRPGFDSGWIPQSDLHRASWLKEQEHAYFKQFIAHTKGAYEWNLEEAGNKDAQEADDDLDDDFYFFLSYNSEFLCYSGEAISPPSSPIAPDDWEDSADILEALGGGFPAGGLEWLQAVRGVV
ncbi:hypothetical protein FBU30_010795 [Linnemannia zychae]|nr:hypothetical protein FBU30_010795 [Linnemannia zychae]